MESESRFNMGKIELNKKRKKETLLNSAFDLFTTKGIQDTSISDIVKNSGVAKGTFYLYFKDKYDVRNLLVAKKSSQLFINAYQDMEKEHLDNLEEKLLYIINHIIDQFAENKSLLMFISKNLSWGVFKNALLGNHNEYDVDFSKIYDLLIYDSEYKFKDPEIMLFMIIELVSSTCYSVILYESPVSLQQLKPYLFKTIIQMIDNHRIKD